MLYSMQLKFKNNNNNNGMLKYNVNTTVCGSTIKIHYSLKIRGYKFLEVNVSSKRNVIRNVVP